MGLVLKIEWITKSAKAKKREDTPPGWGTNSSRLSSVSNTRPGSGNEVGERRDEGTERAYGEPALPRLGKRMLLKEPSGNRNAYFA